MKVPLSFDVLEEVNTSDGYRAYGHPFAPGKVIMGRLAFPRGRVPEPLKPYIGQTAKVAKACKGKRGYAFVKCLREKAKELGITKHE